MVITLYRPQKKIRSVVLFFSLYVALMLFQTDFMRLGTLTASITLIMTLGGYFLQDGAFQSRLRFPAAAVCLALFLLYTVLITVIHDLQPPGFMRYISQIVMCLVLFSVQLSPREHSFLKRVFVIASTVYSLMIILSYAENNDIGQSHARVQLFNTTLDPNFVGIPIVAATAMLLNGVLHKERIGWSLALYAINLVAIVYTASRGSLIGMIVSNFLVFAFFMQKRDIKFVKKIGYLLLPILLLAVLIPFMKRQFPIEWARLFESDYGDGAGRIPLWNRAIQDWWESPVLGHGLGYAYAVHKLETHNTYLQLLSETGLVGVSLWLLYLIPQVYKVFCANKLLFCVVSGALVQILFLNALDDRCLWIILCWIAMCPDKERKKC